MAGLINQTEMKYKKIMQVAQLKQCSLPLCKSVRVVSDLTHEDVSDALFWP